VIGVLYGHRYAPCAHISRMDVRLVKLLATGAATAMARVEQEKRIIKTSVLFEQFVTPRIAQHITANPQLLAGHEVEASFLFCDIVGFSRITYRLNPTQTIAWINDVLETLSQCVLREEGTLVDYVGDELFAMFGSPITQKDHAARACRAGTSMLAALESLNQRWHTQLQEKMGVGIGVNSGRVLVGNIGSMTKLKFGAHGTPVNIASRVQSANRYLRTEFLATEATVSQLGPTFPIRRLCQVRVKNIEQPICLYELPGALPDGWSDLKPKYENALTAWETGQGEQAFRILGRLAADFPDDGPTVALLQRSMEARQSGRAPDIVWQLPGK
jgi:adenylate cyclase